MLILQKDKAFGQLGGEDFVDGEHETSERNLNNKQEKACNFFGCFCYFMRSAKFL